MQTLFIAMQVGGQGQSFVSTLIFFALIFVVFYFMILRPQQKRQKEREKMLSAVKKGDKVVTSGGIHGKVTSVDEKTVCVEVDNNVTLKMEKTAVSVILNATEKSDAK